MKQRPNHSGNEVYGGKDGKPKASRCWKAKRGAENNFPSAKVMNFHEICDFHSGQSRRLSHNEKRSCESYGGKTVRAAHMS